MTTVADDSYRQRLLGLLGRPLRTWPIIRLLAGHDLNHLAQLERL